MTPIQDKLVHAEQIALALFEEVENRQLIHPGKDEKTLNQEIFLLAKEMFDIEKHWHKRIVRSGKNTLYPYDENPPNQIIKEDDILFFDFGPVIEDWEADLGRTYVLGDDPIKHQLKNDVIKAWKETKEWFDQQTSLKASELFAYAQEKALAYGWEFGGPIAGHIIGSFPHENIGLNDTQLFIHPDNHNDMFALNAHGQERHWILEIHFVDKAKEIGSFYEQLLTTPMLQL